MKTTDMVMNFKKALQSRFELYGISVRWYWGSRRSKNIIRMDGWKNGFRILYVKDRSSGKGFWGLTKHQLDEFQSRGHQWDVVLLRGSGECGYLGTSQQVREGSRKWSSSQAGDYKVHEREIEGWWSRFESYDALFSMLLPPSPATQV
jgi:hypothetical protein